MRLLSIFHKQGRSVIAYYAIERKRMLPISVRARANLTSTPRASTRDVTIEPKQSQSRLQRLWEDGSIFFFIGWTGLALMGVDRFLQFQSAQDAQDMVGIIEDETRKKRQELQEKYREAPKIFECVIRTEYKMGGSYGLEGVKVNDVVEVLEEGVGPGQYYNLCRTVNNGETSIGWYPVGFMEKIRPHRRQWWKIW